MELLRTITAGSVDDGKSTLIGRLLCSYERRELKGIHVSGGLGLIASRLNIEGSIVIDKGSFLITGRRTYADALLKLWPTNDDVDKKLFL